MIEIKKIIPKSLKSIVREIKNKKETTTYRQALKEINKTKCKSKKIKIAFIVEFPETWNSLKTVYEAAIEMGIETIILSIPKPKYSGAQKYEINENEINESFEEFKKQNVNAVNAYLGNNKWYDLKKDKPDYVFYTRPYNNQYPDIYNNNTVCQYSKVCFIPYAFSLRKYDNVFNTVINDNFMFCTYITFLPSKISLKMTKSKYAFQNLFNFNKYVFKGFPRFDLLINNKKEKNEKYTVAWMPRWEFDKEKKDQKYSHFLEYYEEFMRFVNENKQINFIFRPHPLMFETIIKEKILTEDELNLIIKQMKQIENLEIDINKDYLPTIFKADILIADETSLLAEYFVTGKPIIYCDNAQGFNKDGKTMDKTLYHAKEWNEVEKQIKLLESGKDEKKEERQITLKKLLPNNSGNIGKSIIKYILDDYKRN